MLQSKAALERAGVAVELFDPWRPQFAAVDVVHYFSVAGGSMAFCDYAKRRGLPLLISPVLWLTPENLPRLPLQEITDLLHRCDRVLPNSDAEARQLALQFGLPLDRFTVTHNAVAAAFGQEADGALFREALGVSGPFVLHVANVEPRKNQLRLAEAVRGLEIDLVVLGRVRDPEYFAACAAAAGSRWRFLGHVEHESELLRSAYRACTVFALPSLLETPGLAALEAAAAGARVVVTRTGSAPEYFGDGAVYVDPLDVADIDRGLREALSAPARVELREHVLSRFTWDRTARELIGAYEAAIASARGGRIVA